LKPIVAPGDETPSEPEDRNLTHDLRGLSTVRLPPSSVDNGEDRGGDSGVGEEDDNTNKNDSHPGEGGDDRSRDNGTEQNLSSSGTPGEGQDEDDDNGLGRTPIIPASQDRLDNDDSLTPPHSPRKEFSRGADDWLPPPSSSTEPASSRVPGSSRQQCASRYPFLASRNTQVFWTSCR